MKAGRLSPIVILTLAFGVSANAADSASAELAGLWKAKKRFGPDARGPLIIHRTGTTYTADMVGRSLPVRANKDELAFDLPNRGGNFRGKLNQGRIVGHWFRFGTPLFGAESKTPLSASPVVLAADGSNRWRGMVTPSEDAFTFYLFVESQADGTLRAVLQNPERDFGTQQGVERITREGDALKLIGKRQGKEQEVADGTYDAENKVITLSFPSRGGTYDFYREGDESDFYPRGKNPGRYSYQVPEAQDDGWPVGTLEEANIDRPAIEKFVQKIIDTPMASLEAPQNHGLLIARHGKLVLEEYFHGEHRDKLHNVRSGGKSVTSLIVGAAMQAGAPLKLSSPVYEVMNGGQFPAEVDPEKRTMTLEHLLTMSAGYFCDDTNDEAPGNEEKIWNNQDAEPDFWRYTMSVPMATSPGENAVYCSAIANLALGMAGRATGENPIAVFDRLIGGPMKIQRYEWGLDGAGNPYGGGGQNLRLRDYMKLGQLMLNSGKWGDRQILSKEFATRAISPLYHLRNIYYGYFFWIEDYPYKNRTVHAVSARGAGGQTVTLIPELNLVVATFAGSFASRKAMFAASTDPIPTVILPAVREPGDDKNAPVVEREYKSPYGASKDGSRVAKLK